MSTCVNTTFERWRPRKRWGRTKKRWQWRQLYHNSTWH